MFLLTKSAQAKIPLVLATSLWYLTMFGNVCITNYLEVFIYMQFNASINECNEIFLKRKCSQWQSMY